ncbi:MAG: hypothetical protein HPZ91_00620 [Lentisphaeria bacterium]|nr:hypothetical protein [Lentisphaeria bacterium]
MHEIDAIFGYVEGFEDEDLQRRIFGRQVHASPKFPRNEYFCCPHCGRKVFVRVGESGVWELVNHFDPERDGRDNVYNTGVILHDCGIDDLFEEENPF